MHTQGLKVNKKKGKKRLKLLFVVHDSSVFLVFEGHTAVGSKARYCFLSPQHCLLCCIPLLSCRSCLLDTLPGSLLDLVISHLCLGMETRFTPRLHERSTALTAAELQTQRANQVWDF